MSKSKQNDEDIESGQSSKSQSTILDSGATNVLNALVHDTATMESVSREMIKATGEFILIPVQFLFDVYIYLRGHPSGVKYKVILRQVFP